MMGKEFKTLFDYAEQMRRRYLYTLAAFKIYERFNKLAAPNIVGKKRAEKGAKILNNYKYFFLTSKEATRCYFLIELAKFFDISKQSLTVYKVINYAKLHISKFSKEAFLRQDKTREILPEILAEYKPLSSNDLQKIERRLKTNSVAIKNLKIYRDKYLAHDDIKKIKVTIKPKDTKVLLRIVKDTIDLLFSRLDFSSNSYRNFEEEPISDLDRVMQDLISHEQQRLMEFELKYGIRKI